MGYAVIPAVIFAFFVILAIGMSGSAMKDLESRRK